MAAKETLTGSYTEAKLLNHSRKEADSSAEIRPTECEPRKLLVAIDFIHGVPYARICSCYEYE